MTHTLSTIVLLFALATGAFAQGSSAYERYWVRLADGNESFVLSPAEAAAVAKANPCGARVFKVTITLTRNAGGALTGSSAAHVEVPIAFTVTIGGQVADAGPDPKDAPFAGLRGPGCWCSDCGDHCNAEVPIRTETACGPLAELFEPERALPEPLAERPGWLAYAGALSVAAE